MQAERSTTNRAQMGEMSGCSTQRGRHSTLLGAAVLMGALAQAAPAEVGPESGERQIITEASREVTKAEDGSVTVTAERQITEVDTGRTGGSTHTFVKSPTEEGHIWSSESTRTNLEGASFSRSAEGEVSREEGTRSVTKSGVRTNEETGKSVSWDKSFNAAKIDTGEERGIEWTKVSHVADNEGHAFSKQASGSIVRDDDTRVRHVERSATNETTGESTAFEHTTTHVRPANANDIGNGAGSGSPEFDRPGNSSHPGMGQMASVGHPSNLGPRPQHPAHPQRPNMARPGHPERPGMTRPQRPQRPERPNIARPERPDFERPERPERPQRVVRVVRVERVERVERTSRPR